MKELTIVDTFGFLFRSYHALPPLQSSKGVPTGLLTGFLNFINQFFEQERGYLLFALDSPSKSFRNSIDPLYKANRPEPPKELKQQLEIAISWLEKMNLPTLSKEGFEADDIIASVTKLAKKEGVKVKIITSDKDLFQLVEDPLVRVLNPVSKEEFDENGVIRKFGLPPSKLRDFFALVGDSVDNIKGVRGVGAKTALDLLKAYSSLEEIYENLESIPSARVRTLLEKGREDAFKSRELFTLKDDLFEKVDLEKFKLPLQNPILKIVDELLQYEITAILKRLKKAPLQEVKEKREVEKIGLKKDEVLKTIFSIPKESFVALHLEIENSKLLGFSFTNTPYKIFFTQEIEALKEVFNRFKVVGFDLKTSLKLLYSRYNFPPQQDFIDVMILAWLLNPDEKDKLSLGELAKRFLNRSLPKKEESLFLNSLGEEASIIYSLHLKFLNLLSPTLWQEAKKVEFPLINVLAKMELEGIEIDPSHFKELKKEISSQLKELTTKIYTLANEEFNINSPKQLGKILFEKLKLTPIKKTKTGYSTNEKVLRNIKHPIIDLILEYRQLFKLQSTYIDPLLNYSKTSTRIHTTFIQTGTATGRLASKNPNLQNLPIKTPLGKKIREGFVASKGNLLVGIDYSQIELRLLAHFSQDPALIQAFQQGEDIHLQTSLKLFKTTNKRHIAKSINFGLIYGMGSRKLSQTLGVSVNEAKEIIENYFKVFKRVKEYLEFIKEQVIKDGYVETLLKRRRYFNFKYASEVEKAAFLREATNTVFQGSAADLIKLAMNKEEVKKEKLLLQIHDELIFEIPKERAIESSQKLKKMMEGVYSLKVPLECSIWLNERWKEEK